MVSTVIRQPAHINPVAPRGAVWAADFAASVYQLLESIGSNRARRALRIAGDKWQSIDPQRADVMRAAEAHLASQVAAPKAAMPEDSSHQVARALARSHRGFGSASY